MTRGSKSGKIGLYSMKRESNKNKESGSTLTNIGGKKDEEYNKEVHVVSFSIIYHNGCGKYTG